MSTQVAGRIGSVLPPPLEYPDANRTAASLGPESAGNLFAQVRAPAGAESKAQATSDGWEVSKPISPRRAPRGAPPTDVPDIAIPDSVGRDGRRRMAYKLGVLAARELGLDAAAIGAQDLMALGGQAVADHALSGTPEGLLVAVARMEGKVDDGAWASGDKDRIAAQVDDFLRAEFKDEMDLYQALDALAAEPPLLGRGELADALLREQGVDPEALLEGPRFDAEYPSVSASSPPLVRSQRAGNYYFNRDKLTADGVRRMRTSAGATLTDEHVERVLRALPDSLDAEFTRRFDSQQQRMSALLAQWLSARLSLHASEAGIGLAGATVAISRATMRLFAPAPGMRIGNGGKYSEVYGTRPSRGFLVSIQSAGKTHQCFVSSQTGAVRVLPEDASAESWLRKEHELAFDDGAALAALAATPGRWLARVTVEEKASGPSDSIREWLPAMFHAEIEKGREAARGETLAEAGVDALLNLIPFRAMVVALRKGDIPTSIVMGALDMLTLIPLVGAGVRLTGAAARSAAPWLAMGVRFGGAAARPGLNGLRRLAGGVPQLRDRIKQSLVGSAAQGWGRLRPLDVQRVAQALRPTAPGLADILDGVVARSRAAAVPDGVWRVRGAAAATAEAGDTITAVRAVTARNTRGGTLNLLPYGERSGVYTQVDAAGLRTGALLVADSGGWLHQTLPVSSLERYRVATPADIRMLEHGRVEPDGTVGLNGNRYARLGADYVQVIPDAAVSTAARPIWRVAAPPDVAPDLIVHRLFHDARDGLWRRADVPGLSGGGNQSSRYGLRGRWRGAVSPGMDVRVSPDSKRLARLQDAMAASALRDALPDEVDVLRALFDRIARDRRGLAIMRAMTAHYELTGQAPEIVLRAAGDAAARPSLDHPTRTHIWQLDLDAIGNVGEQAIDEFAAVYNNMTGLLQNDDPLVALRAEGLPALDPRLEQAWDEWRRQGAEAARSGGQGSTAIEPRELALRSLRRQLEESRCYGGVDKATFKAILRNERTSRGMKIDLSHHDLDSVPPLPADVRVLIMSHNPVRDWSHLPERLSVLRAEGTRMTRLPSNLPAGLLELDVSGNLLRTPALVFPPGLRRLDIGRNRLGSLPLLPASLRELISDGNHLRDLSGLPSELRLVDVSDNQIARLPANLPAGLKVLYASRNRLAQLPGRLPATLEELDVSSNRLRELTRLPDTLRILDADTNLLEELPDNLPRGMQILAVSNNRLRGLPRDLPPDLRILALQRNDIVELPPGIATLESARIHLDGNPLSLEDIPVISADRAGPRIFFSMLRTSDQRVQHVRTLLQAVQQWWSKSAGEDRARWETVAQAMGMHDGATQFSLFLDLLRTSVSYSDAAFRAQVEDWLVELAKPERSALLQDTLAVCEGAAESCEDRIVSVWNDMQKLRLNDDIRQGLYDSRMADVVAIARQMFRIDALTDIARQKERTLSVSDEVEVYLSYVVKLRDSLGLTTVAPGMRFYDRREVTAEDLEVALEQVRARERDGFEKFLVLDYEPWQTLLKRRDAKAYADAEQRSHDMLEAFEQRLQQEIDRLGLDPQDQTLVADARKDLGPGIMRQIRYEAMAELTTGYLGAEG
ncbi:NEL-type E3 ubiquitin ligase domain-containing protein [Bordetella genomosp. 11]|uniref:NEL domain-containing protein n=1 Tax=Bordetella genomosp. 11 TaxID=1416808 RepID=A0A261UI72_9BORD|nr:NEL-type E3 ubiquitin ligase domain-containing protein [Bordetella genomosp. 11]OZI61638.1 hypothetical protein CAL28_20385 [Bordetella genomosp. 11]